MNHSEEQAVFTRVRYWIRSWTTWIQFVARVIAPHLLQLHVQCVWSCYVLHPQSDVALSCVDKCSVLRKVGTGRTTGVIPCAGEISARFRVQTDTMILPTPSPPPSSARPDCSTRSSSHPDFVVRTKNRQSFTAMRLYAFMVLQGTAIVLILVE